MKLIVADTKTTHSSIPMDLGYIASVGKPNGNRNCIDICGWQARDGRSSDTQPHNGCPPYPQGFVMFRKLPYLELKWIFPRVFSTYAIQPGVLPLYSVMASGYNNAEELDSHQGKVDNEHNQELYAFSGCCRAAKPFTMGSFCTFIL